MKNKQWTTPLPFYNLLLLIIIAQSRLKQNLYKKYQQPTCSWFSSDSYDDVPSSDSMTSPSFWQKIIHYTKHHLSSICDCKPTSVLIFKKNKHWSERKPWNNGSVLFKMTLRTTIPRLEVQDFVFWTPGWKRIATWKNLANFFKFNSCVPSRGRTLHEHSFFMFRDFRLLLQGILKIASATNLVWL